MAREHARILCRIWDDEDFVARSPEAQRMYMLLLSQRSLNHAGVAPLTLERWASKSPGTTRDDVLRWLEELQAHDFVVFDTRTEELLVRSFIRGDGVVKQPNVLKGALRLAGDVSSPRLRFVLADELDKLGIEAASATAVQIRPSEPVETLTDEASNPSERVREPFENPSETLPDLTPSEPFAKGSVETRGKGVGGTPVVATAEVVDGLALPARNARPRKATRIPEDFAVTDEMVKWAKRECPDVNGKRETERFVDHWRGKSGKDGTKLDWVATWRNWMRNAHDRAYSGRGSPASGPKPSTTDQRVAEAQALKAKLATNRNGRIAGEITP